MRDKPGQAAALAVTDAALFAPGGAVGVPPVEVAELLMLLALVAAVARVAPDAAVRPLWQGGRDVHRRRTASSDPRTSGLSRPGSSRQPSHARYKDKRGGVA